MMRIVLVDLQQGKRVIKWANYFALSFCLSRVLGGEVGGVFYLLSGRWSHGVVLYGIAMGLGMAAFGLIRGFAAPVDQSTALD